MTYLGIVLFVHHQAEGRSGKGVDVRPARNSRFHAWRTNESWAGNAT